jgi:hypothetical protein
MRHRSCGPTIALLPPTPCIWQPAIRACLGRPARLHCGYSSPPAREFRVLHWTSSDLTMPLGMIGGAFTWIRMQFGVLPANIVYSCDAATSPLPRLGSWVRIPSPAPSLEFSKRPSRRAFFILSHEELTVSDAVLESRGYFVVTCSGGFARRCRRFFRGSVVFPPGFRNEEATDPQSMDLVGPSD